MGLDRRTFLKQAGLTLFAWEATDIGLSILGKNYRPLNTLVNRYQQALAEPTSGKLALLVGINRYPHQENLNGCLTDVELQKELLVHRFGFNPQDIMVLSDRQATRENIETAFVEHLGQAKADDAVFFHFSGYGGQIKVPLTSEIATANDLDSVEYKLANSLVPVDGILPAKKSSISNSILQDTLLLLAQSLSTSKCTFVLDTSFNYSPRAQHSNFKVRSAKEVAEGPSSPELVFLEQLRSNLANKGLKPSKRLLSLPGVVFSASKKNQIAVERQWDDFSAGLFTQALTQHLWQINPRSKVQVALAQTAASVEQVMGRQQQPTLNSPDKSEIAYYLATSEVGKATGVVSKSNKNYSEVKLLGLPGNILNAYGVNSCFSLTSQAEATPSVVQIKSIDGWTAKTQLLNYPSTATPEVGDFLQEYWRVLDRNLGLTLGLDGELQRIERVDATSALANITTVDSTVVLGEQNADCLLGRVHHQNSLEEDHTFSYGLYTTGGKLIGKTSGADDEAVKIAIERLQPHFNNLLAIKWLNLTNNDFSSQLKLGMSLTSTTESQAIALQKATSAFESGLASEKKSLFASKNSSVNSGNNVPILVKGSDIQLSLNNMGDRELYALLLGIDADSNIFALYTPAKSQSTEGERQLTDIVVPSQTQLTIPQLENSWKWKVGDSIGINTLYGVFAIKPFTQTVKALAAQQNFKLDQQQVLNVVNPIAVIKSLMEDLHAASSISNDLIANSNAYALDVNSWATLNFVYEISNQ